MMMSAGETPAPAPLRLTSSTAGDIAVIAVEGVLDATTRQQFADHLDQAGTSIILDLAGAVFMDSRALGLIIHHW
ncbi:STAS domain-containing protein [Nonomuraea fuscirosea]|nr:STAS domain-containing protein [Nonomuraea fuscirosea]WSA55712.1 STAS domain-containing protein [Nonomuraea fuscirosea]